MAVICAVDDAFIELSGEDGGKYNGVYVAGYIIEFVCEYGMAAEFGSRGEAQCACGLIY